MADYGVTENGFNRKTREEIVSNMIAKANNFFGSDLNESDKNPLIKFIKICSYPISLVWFGLESVYNSSYINTATGQSLDYTVKYLGLERQSATKAIGEVTFSGDDGTTVPEGFLVETDNDEPIQFETTESGDISGGSIILAIQSVETGEDKNVSSGTITAIVNPTTGIDSVINNNDTYNGSDEETDFELRERYKSSVAAGGKATIDSIISELLSVESTQTILLRVNFTDVTDSDGLPPKSIEAIVYKGLDGDIAQALLDSVGAGIQTHGDTNAIATAQNDIDYTMYFTRPSEINIYVDISVTKANSYPSDGDTQVGNKIIEYINNLSVNESVVYTKIIEVAHSVTGVEDVSLTIGISDNPTGTANISISETEVAISDETKVDVS